MSWSQPPFSCPFADKIEFRDIFTDLTLGVDEYRVNLYAVCPYTGEIFIYDPSYWYVRFLVQGQGLIRRVIE
jgi:hypothetical protein